VVIAASACQRKFTCPAYQSAFLLDPEVQRQTFSNFGEDSLPSVDYIVYKTSYLTIRPVKKKKKEKGFYTIPMVTVFPELVAANVDSLGGKPAMDVPKERPKPKEEPELPADGF
jgi:hypothetical protein